MTQPSDQDYRARALKYVRHVMAETDLTATALAKKAKLAASTLCRPLHNPEHNWTLSLSAISKIAKATGIDPGGLLRSPADGLYVHLSGTALAEARKAKKLTQSDVGNAVGAHWITISKLERGEMKVTLDWLHRLAPVLGLSLSTGIPPSDTAALTDLLGFLHYVRAERGVDVPERHFETLRALSSPTSAEPGR